MILPALGLSNNYPMLNGYNAVPRFWRINGYNQLRNLRNLTLQPDLEPNASKIVNTCLNSVVLSFKHITVLSVNSDSFNNAVPVFKSQYRVFWRSIIAKYSMHKIDIVGDRKSPSNTFFDMKESIEKIIIYDSTL